MPNLLEVKLYGSEILNKVAEPVTELTTELKELVADMLHTMYFTEGVGIAAPQVGVSSRIFVCDYEYTKSEKKKPLVLINPEILEYEGEYHLDEGCLSVPGVFEEITRFQRIVIRYRDLKWKEKIVEATDAFAVILQHEYDHLDGKTFVDKLNPIRKMANAIKLKRIANRAAQMSNELLCKEDESPQDNSSK
ncbi:MAG: peptide deformylase [Candidatus Cloacimonetes bacterium]|nr:peptide deformylase [Candidatus Cloacimonadota bacterium]